MTTIILLIIALLLLLGVVALLSVRLLKREGDAVKRLADMEGRWAQLLSEMGEEVRRSRTEQNSLIRDTRLELSQMLREQINDQATAMTILRQEQNVFTEKMTHRLERITGAVADNLSGMQRQLKDDAFTQRAALDKVFHDFSGSFEKGIHSFKEGQQEKLRAVEKLQHDLVVATQQKLEEMRKTVDEKLQQTLNERLGRSFERVGQQLERVQHGLGEMQTLARDVGGLKKVLSNVKLRGGMGEVQLAMLLEQILAPDQYAANVATKAGSNEKVEFAVRLPGRDPHQSEVWLPVDAKFPKDIYEKLVVAQEGNDPAILTTAQKAFEQTIRKMASDIRQKYIDPPNTTDFAVMFLPFEGIYAAVVRDGDLLQALQSEYKVMVTGPTTFAAILNSLQMGFRTLAIQKRSSEVWQVLASVKQEFENFSGMLGKAQKNIQTGLGQLDEVMGRRTKAIQRKLKHVSDPRTNTPMLPGDNEAVQ